MAIPTRRALLLLLLFSLLSGCRNASPDPASISSNQLPYSSATSPILAAYRGTLTSGPEASLTLEPIRDLTAIGDVYNEVGLTTTLLRSFVGSLLITHVERITPEAIEVTLRVKHPFPLATRPDLHAFNLKAHLQTPVAGFAGGLATDPGRLLNADGYSQLWASQLPDGALEVMPYRILTEDRSAPPFNPQAPAGWNVFAAGSTQEATLQLALPESVDGLPVSLYLTADFGQSAVFATRQTPMYSLPEFAGKAPWKVRVTTLHNELGAGIPDSSADYRLEIWHWAHGAGIDADVRAPLTVRIPALQPDITIASLTGTGTDPSPLTAEFTISNTNMVGAGRFLGVVEVGTTSSTGVGLQDDLVTPFDVKSYSTWQLFWAEVGSVPPIGDPPVPVITAPCTEVPISVGRQVNFDATGTMDTEDSPGELTYEWDSDYNGAKFLPDVVGQQANFTYDSPGTKSLALAVTDTDSNRVMVTMSLEVIDSPWAHVRELAVTPGIDDGLDEADQVSDGLLFTPTGEPMVFTRDSEDIDTVSLLRFGNACPPVAMSIPIGTDLLPDATVLNGVATITYIDGFRNLRAATIDLTSLVLADDVEVMDAEQLLPGSTVRDRAIVVDSDSGNLLIVAETRELGDSRSMLWATEKTPTGGWGTPFLLIERANGTDFNAPEIALGMSAGAVTMLWADTVPGPPHFEMRRTMTAEYTFGTGDIDDPVSTGLPLGDVHGYAIRSAPDGGVVGTCITDARPRFLRFDPIANAWSGRVIGDRESIQRDTRIAVDAAGLVNVVWIEDPTVGPSQLVSKQFPYDAPDGVIGDGDMATIRMIDSHQLSQPQLGIDPTSGLLALAWVENFDAELRIWGATY